MAEAAKFSILPCILMFVGGVGALIYGLVTGNSSLTTGGLVVSATGGFGTYAIFELLRLKP